MTSPEIDLACAFPILASLDIEETKRFYRNTLGFTEIAHEAADYLIVRRNDLDLHFWLTQEAIFPQNTSCHIRGGQIAALYDAFKDCAVPDLSSFEVRPWNMNEFTIHDPHGNLLRFGAASQELC
jgi:catechol 2,3-dioxygenase-like lactoylglutathione lyase family enzyme